MLWKIKKTWVAFVLAAALLCLCGCGTDDINISGYAGEEIVLAGLAEEDVVITIRDMKAMDFVTVRTESTSDKIGKVRATGPTLETVLAQAARGAGGLQYENFVNVLELYTLKAYPEAQALKARMEGTAAEAVLMSGSGPTIFAVFGGMEDAKAACSALREEGYEAYWTKTIV